MFWHCHIGCTQNSGVWTKILHRIEGLTLMVTRVPSNVESDDDFHFNLIFKDLLNFLMLRASLFTFVKNWSIDDNWNVCTTNFVAFSHYYGGNAGEVFVFFILTVAAAEAAIGLAIVLLLYRNRGNINVNKMNHLKG